MNPSDSGLRRESPSVQRLSSSPYLDKTLEPSLDSNWRCTQGAYNAHEERCSHDKECVSNTLSDATPRRDAGAAKASNSLEKGI